MEGQYLVDSYWNFNYEILFFYLHFSPQPTPPLNCKSGSGSGSQGAEACPSMHGDREKCTLDRSPVKKQHLIHIYWATPFTCNRKWKPFFHIRNISRNPGTIIGIWKASLYFDWRKRSPKMLQCWMLFTGHLQLLLYNYIIQSHNMQ